MADKRLYCWKAKRSGATMSVTGFETPDKSGDEITITNVSLIENRESSNFAWAIQTDGSQTQLH